MKTPVDLRAMGQTALLRRSARPRWPAATPSSRKRKYTHSHEERVRISCGSGPGNTAVEIR
eukprot:9933442-Lingulodinium_polyedra.AAC.1